MPGGQDNIMQVIMVKSILMSNSLPAITELITLASYSYHTNWKITIDSFIAIASGFTTTAY